MFIVIIIDLGFRVYGCQEILFLCWVILGNWLVFKGFNKFKNELSLFVDCCYLVKLKFV